MLRSSLLLAALVAAMAITAPSAFAAVVTVTNQTPLTIPQKGVASEYPSAIEIQNLAGRITSVGVNLRGVGHDRANHLDVLLVSPRGTASVLMSDACGSTAVDSPSIAFDEAFPTIMPSGPPCGGGFKPTDYPGDEPDSWPNAPDGPYPSNLDSFIGEQANGAWKLYVYDDTTLGRGYIANGWALTVGTAIPDADVAGPGAANPYPIMSSVTRSGIVTDVDVRLDGIYHHRPSDLDVLLVGPRGQRVMLMSDACSSSLLKNQTFVWDDSGPAMTELTACTTEAYAPTDHQPGDELPAPAPAGPYTSGLSVFNGTEPSGDWKMYVNDDGVLGGEGFFVDRFRLDIETRPKAAVAFADETVEVTEGQPGEITLTRSGAGSSLGEGAVFALSSPGGATSGTDFEPVATAVVFMPGETQQTIPIAALVDDVAEGAETFTVEIGGGHGDAEAGTPARTTVTIRDAPPQAGGPGPGPGTGPAPGQIPGGVDTVGGTDLPGRPNDPVAGDREAPVLSGLTLARRAIRYRLSEPAAVTVTIRRRGRRARTARTLRSAGQTGRNRVAVRLRRGTYRLTVTAVDAAGNRTTRARVVRIGARR